MFDFEARISINELLALLVTLGKRDPSASVYKEGQSLLAKLRSQIENEYKDKPLEENPFISGSLGLKISSYLEEIFNEVDRFVTVASTSHLIV